MDTILQLLTANVFVIFQTAKIFSFKFSSFGYFVMMKRFLSSIVTLKIDVVLG